MIWREKGDWGVSGLARSKSPYHKYIPVNRKLRNRTLGGQRLIEAHLEKSIKDKKIRITF